MSSIQLDLLTLNIWGGHVSPPLLDFIHTNKDIDVFCLQEVYSNAPDKISNENRPVNLNIFEDLSAILLDHTGFFTPVVREIYGLSIFVKNKIKVLNQGNILIYHNPCYKGIGPAHSRILQYIHSSLEGKEFLIVNIHGLWNGNGKTDSLDRIKQSQKIKSFINQFTCPKILCGDFNLRPDTSSLIMLEDNMINCIKKYNITSTRTSFYTGKERFADYVLVSPEFKINQFSVLPDEVSDHSPCYINCEL